MRSQSASETIECPLCYGAGELSRAEILDRLGVKDFARVAQLSAEEAFRLLQNRHDREHQSAWSRFETELAKRTAEIREQHKDELRLAQSEKDDLTRRVEDCLREVARASRTKPSNWKPRWRRSPMWANARRWISQKRRGLGLGIADQREAAEERRLPAGVPRSEWRSAGAAHPH